MLRVYKIMSDSKSVSYWSLNEYCYYPCRIVNFQVRSIKEGGWGLFLAATIYLKLTYKQFYFHESPLHYLREYVKKFESWKRVGFFKSIYPWQPRRDNTGLMFSIKIIMDRTSLKQCWKDFSVQVTQQQWKLQKEDGCD